MASITIFRKVFVGTLRANINANLDKYRRRDKWIGEVATKAVRDLDTRLQFKCPLELEDPDDDNLRDLENAIRIHKSLHDLSPLQARDPRLWTHLTHVEGWDYMRKRWHIERAGADNEKASRFVLSRYFIAQDDSRALLRNGMARLWWTAYMTFDPTRNNPYELTAVLLSRLDITQQILERNIGRSPVILLAFLEFLLQNKAMLLTGGDQNRERIRKLAIALNLYGGVCLLDCLSQMDLLKILATELERALASEKKKEVKVKA